MKYFDVELFKKLIRTRILTLGIETKDLRQQGVGATGSEVIDEFRKQMYEQEYGQPLVLVVDNPDVVSTPTSRMTLKLVK